MLLTGSISGVDNHKIR